MFILEKPYISDFLKQSLVKLQVPVLNTNVARELLGAGKINFISENSLVKTLRSNPSELIYTNSENAIKWIYHNLQFTELPGKIDLFKNKFKFRKLVQSQYPEFFFKEVRFDELDKLSIEGLSYPFIIKPSVGFFSLGVHKVIDAFSWEKTKSILKSDIRTIKGVYPKEVLDVGTLIIEANIEGEEFAFDAYFNRNGRPVILSLLKHLFSSDGDVHDRIYISSKEIIENYIEQFLDFLQKLGHLSGLKNFPLHVEVRVDKSGKLIPIEINPLRFGGWCTTTDMTGFAYGFNPYEYLHLQKIPDWKSILKNKKGKIYSNIVLNNSTGIEVDKINSFNYENLLSKFEKTLEIRKADFKKFLIFGFLFTETREENFKELEWILHTDLKEFISYN
ncbi:MAG: ATP-grasp domain-containing protein [Bacteroidales bacterium]